MPLVRKAGLNHFYVEANLVDDGVPIAENSAHRTLKGGKYVIFDVETTGLSAIYDKVIELSAVKMENGNVIDEFGRVHWSRVSAIWNHH